MGWSLVMKHIFNQISPIAICKTTREPILTAHLSQFCVIEKILICVNQRKLKGKNWKRVTSAWNEVDFSLPHTKPPQTKQKTLKSKTFKESKFPKTTHRYPPHPPPSTEKRAIRNVWSILVFYSFMKYFHI